MNASASEVIGDPTDLFGTQRPSLPPEPTTGTHYKPMDCPFFPPQINLPCDSSNPLAIWELFFPPILGILSVAEIA